MVWDYGGCLDYREEGEDTHYLSPPQPPHPPHLGSLVPLKSDGDDAMPSPRQSANMGPKEQG